MKKAIVIIEDNKAIRDQLVKIINGAPDLECADAFGSAEEALPRIEKNAPDVILMDIGLPNMSGIECLNVVKQTIPSVNVIMITVFNDNEHIFQALKAGADGYLVKSGPPEQLLAAIRDVNNGSVPLSCPVAYKMAELFRKSGFSAVKTENLSSREWEVLDSLATGFSYREIGARYGVEMEMVRGHVRKICQKLHARIRVRGD